MIHKTFFKNYIWIGLILLIVPTFISLIRPGLFQMQDDLQVMRLYQMHKCIEDLQIPCRWVPDMGYQYGYPQFLFYSPSVYYLGEILVLLGVGFIDAIKILFILGFVLSALSMFILLKSFLGNWPAFVGAILYTYVPYKALEVYVRGALSEFWSLVIFPVIFWSSYQVVKQGKLKYFLWFALSVGGLMVTHNLMSLIFLPIAGVWILTWIYLEKAWKNIVTFVAGGLLSLGLAAFFVLPLIFESKFVHLETLLGGYFDWRQHFVNLNQLFISIHYEYGDSILGPLDKLSLSTGQIHWVVALVAIILAAVTFKRFKKIAVVTFVLGIVELLVLFLMHQRSTFLWEIFTPLSWLQFPWRFLAISIFLLSILSGIAVYLVDRLDFKLRGQNLAVIFGIILIVGSILLYGNFFKPYRWFDISDQDKFTGESWEKQLTISIFDYLPIYAKLPPNKKAPQYPEILEGEAEFTQYSKGSNFQTGQVIVNDEALIRLPLFDFPGMKVKVDGLEVTHWNDNCRGQEFCLGLITFKIPEGDHKIDGRLTRTPVRIAGDTISLISLAFLIWLLFKGYKNEKIFKE